MASLPVQAAKTYTTYVAANYLSNFILHPTQKMDYGLLNRALDREVDSEWWGTRSEHIFTIAGTLTFFDHALRRVWKPAGFGKTPVATMAHLTTFVSSGIMAYVAQDAAFNPAHEGKRMEAFLAPLYPVARGVSCMWVPAATGELLAAAGFAASTGNPLGVIPLGTNLVAFTCCKGFIDGEWLDYGNTTLTPHEKKLNGIGQVLLQIDSHAAPAVLASFLSDN
eukprot:jgi/Mesvir1/3457/Mv11951-RA.1